MIEVIIKHNGATGRAEADWGDTTAPEYDVLLAAIRAAAEAAGFDSHSLLKGNQ